MTPWEDPWSLFIFIYSPSSFPLLVFFSFIIIIIFTFSPPLLLQGGSFFLKEKGNKRTEMMDQADILRKFIQGVKAMREGDEERGEDNFGSDFMVGQKKPKQQKNN